MLRSYNWGEYNNNKFNDCCDKYKIKIQFTIPYTPQLYNVAKWKNRIIIEMATCMLGNIPSLLQGEAMITIIYTLNGCTIKFIEEKTLFETWIRKKPNISHFRVFGYEAFFYIIFLKRKKLDKGSKRYIFVGYDS